MTFCSCQNCTNITSFVYFFMIDHIVIFHWQENELSEIAGFWRESWEPIQYKDRCLTSIGIPILEIRQSYDRLISTMGFSILVRWHLYIESGPWFVLKLHYYMVWFKTLLHTDDKSQKLKKKTSLPINELMNKSINQPINQLFINRFFTSPWRCVLKNQNFLYIYYQRTTF